MEFLEIPANRAPANGLTFALTADDGLTLRVARWPAGDAACGSVVIFQGRGEFIEKYFETVDRLLARGFEVVAFDWRGQGLSAREIDPPQKGHIDDFSLYERDVEAIVRAVLPLCPKPWFALAHSMGASILLGIAGERELAFERMATLAPMLDFRGLKNGSATAYAVKCLDNMGFGTVFARRRGKTPSLIKPFAGNDLTSDPVRYARNAEIANVFPQLALGQPTIGWVNAALRQTKKLMDPNFARRVKTPLLGFAAGCDSVVDNSSAELFFSRAKLAQMINISGARHEILQERENFQAQFWDAFDAFIPGLRVDKL